MMKTKFLKGQVTLELTAALIILFILVGGTFRFFLWANKRMVLRQEAYESTRVAAGSDQELIDMQQKLAEMGNFWYGYYDPEKAKEYLELKEAIKKKIEEGGLTLVDESALPELDILGDNK